MSQLPASFSTSQKLDFFPANSQTRHFAGIMIMPNLGKNIRKKAMHWQIFTPVISMQTNGQSALHPRFHLDPSVPEVTRKVSPCGKGRPWLQIARLSDDASRLLKNTMRQYPRLTAFEVGYSLVYDLTTTCNEPYLKARGPSRLALGAHLISGPLDSCNVHRINHASILRLDISGSTIHQEAH